MTVQPAGPPDPGSARSLDDLVGGLRALKVWAGDPSFETITRRINTRWRAAGRREDDLARRGTVVDCFKTGRRRINAELMVAVVQTLHDYPEYVTRWRQALRDGRVGTETATQVRVLDRLPDDLPAFVGRDADIDRIVGLTGVPAVTGSVAVLAGMAGIGKTRLAVHAGRQLLGEGHLDTVLFADLRGFHPDPALPPAEPAVVLDAFLRLLGGPADEVPPGLPARSAALRERLAGRRALIVLDNAAGADQVRPLLARTAGALTLITSRRRMTGLAPDLHLDVGLFTDREAEQLLIRSVPGVPVGTDPAAHRRVARRCGHLPLALSVVAAQIAARTGWTVTDHADRLDERHHRHRLDSAVELALQRSYQHLPAQHQAILRRLALHPGPDLDRHAAAALLGTDPHTAAGHLRRLADESLVQEPAPGRYALHELVRAYAAERGSDEDRPADRTQALTRLREHDRSTACR